jgi:dTMP kinase
MFITLEGIEGVGKTTHLHFMETYLAQAGISICSTREPGGTVLGNELRNLLLAPRQERMHPTAELLLLFSARVQHVESLIKPALAEGKWVICDRFVDATYAYQGAGRGIPYETLRSLEQLTLGDFRPDHTFIFDAPVEQALARMKARGIPDRIESETQAFFERARHYYQSLPLKDLTRYSLIDASGSLEAVQTILMKELCVWIKKSQEKTC